MIRQPTNLYGDSEYVVKPVIRAQAERTPANLTTCFETPVSIGLPSSMKFTYDCNRIQAWFALPVYAHYLRWGWFMFWFKSKGFHGKQRDVVNKLIIEFLRQEERETNSYPSVDDEDGIMLGGTFKPYTATSDEDKNTGWFSFVFMLGRGESLTENRVSLLLSEDMKSISYEDKSFLSDQNGLSSLVAKIISDAKKQLTSFR